MVSFGEGLKYPWGAPVRLLNILWALIPIIGIFTILGYVVKIVKSVVKGNKKSLPEFGSWGENTKEGFFFFIRMIPLMIILWFVSFILAFIPIIGWLAILAIEVFLLPWLAINLMVKGDLAASFEVVGAIKAVFSNFVEYLFVILKTIGYVVVYFVLCIVLVGIPCLYFGNNLFLAEFYATKKA